LACHFGANVMVSLADCEQRFRTLLRLTPSKNIYY
jgi:hypothetical protein